VAASRNIGEPSTSSIARLHLSGGKRAGPSKKLSLRHVGRIRAQSNEGDKVRELASEKAVESGKQFDEDATKLAGNGQSPVVLDAKVEDASDAASYEPEVREKVVDVASDMAVDNFDDVDALAKKDAAPLAEAWGRSLDDTAEALEAKAAEISEREARKESSSSSSDSDSENSSKPKPFFEDQVIKESVLDVASASAVDDGSEVDATAEKDASEMINKVGGDQRRNKVTIKGLADTASKLEADSSMSLQQLGEQISGFKETISKNLKEGIETNQPKLEELSRTASQRVKEGQEYVRDAGEVEFPGDAQNVLEDAKGALDKRQSAINLAVEDARETGELVADLAVKGWDALTKTTEKFVAKFQKNAEVAKEKAQETAEQAKVKAEETADQAQKQFAEAKSNLEAKTAELRDAAEEKGSESKVKLQEALDEAQRMFNEAKQNVESKSGELKDQAQEKASEGRSKLEDTAETAKSKLGDAKETAQSKAGEFKDAAQEKASEAKSKVQDTAETAQSKAGEFKDAAQEKASEAKSKAEDTAETAQSKLGDAKENVESKTGELKDAAQEKASEAKSKVEDTAETAQSKTGELKDAAQEKASESKSKLEDTAESAQSKAGELKDSAQEKASEAKSGAESKVKEESRVWAKDDGGSSTGRGQTPGWGSSSSSGGSSSGGSSTGIGQTPGWGSSSSSGGSSVGGSSTGIGQTPTRPL
jgi:hypothetical protein